ncbi:MAG: hypothetical protein M3Y66_08330 [Actinomycetota bacterium]|nr:hypothetical protein [Actinomycetota bacterium]
MKLHNLPTRLATGAYILHSGIEKWGGGPDTATGVHGMASGAFPAFTKVDPQTFLRTLSLGEMAVGTALLAPFVPSAMAGAALTGFSGALVTMYLRTSGLHKPGSVWPTPQGIGVSKDVWMLGIGLGMVFEALKEKTAR